MKTYPTLFRLLALVLVCLTLPAARAALFQVPIAAGGGGGGSLATNANQFGASTTLTLKSGSLQTNNTFYGTHTISGASSNVGSNPYITSKDTGAGFAGFLAYDSTSALFLDTSVQGLISTNSASIFYLWGGVGAGTSLSAQFAPTGTVFYGHVTGASNITASSFIGSGTGAPIIKLATMMSADNAFAISVRTNWTQLYTNFFEFINLQPDDEIIPHSSTAGQAVWTNRPATSISVLRYGADRSGTTDSTLAFANAMTNAGATIRIPTGIYILTNVFPTNVTVVGDGIGRTVLRFNTNAVPYGYMFDMVRNRSHWRDITFDGGSTTNLKGFATSDEARSGIRLWADGANSIRDCQFYGWHSNAVYVSGTDDTTARVNAARISDNWFTNCWRGAWMADTNTSEYCQVSGNRFGRSEIGLKVDSANINVTGNIFVDAAVDSYPLNGRSHSLYSGNTFNHTTISFQNAASGASVVGNHLLGATTIYLYSPSEGVFVSNNKMENVTVADYTLGKNQIVYNSILTALTTNGGTKISLYHGNRLTSSGALTKETIELEASATLDFPSTAAGAVSDLTIAVVGATDGDTVALGEPSGAIGPLTGTYNSWTSNGVVFVRFANNNLVSAQDPASGTFKVRVFK